MTSMSSNVHYQVIAEVSINKITFSVNSICVHDRTSDLVIITSRFPYKLFEHAIYDFYFTDRERLIRTWLIQNSI